MVNGLDARGVVCGGNTTDQAQSVAPGASSVGAIQRTNWIFPICISCIYVHRTLGRGIGSGSVNARGVVCRDNATDHAQSVAHRILSRGVPGSILVICVVCCGLQKVIFPQLSVYIVYIIF